jgi:class 3 adenylate cyclase
MAMNLELIGILQSYVPPVVLRRVLEVRAPSTKPSADRFSAAVLFADITNFTALSERLSALDLGGAEQLGVVLNRSFDHLITVIHEYGGEVTKFAGDALIALWPVPETVPRLGSQAQQALAEAVERAANCALTIQAQFPKEPVEELKVSVEIGISAGDVYIVHLGGVLNRWEYLLSGTPLVDMSQAINLAGPGEIVLSPLAWGNVDERLNGEFLTGGFAKLVGPNSFLPEQSAIEIDVPEDVIDNLKSYVPAAILPRIEAGMDEWLSELRRVSVMFITLPGYGASITHPFERTLPEAQAVMQALQRALYRYGGSINKLNVDDKGITLVAAFGLPPFSQQDDSARIIHSALEMQSVLNHLGRPSAIGITTGWVYCGPIGNSERREYTMVGRDVNMATRLMQIAESNLASSEFMSDIFCDESTYRDVQAQIKSGTDLALRLSFEPELLVYVKGREEPVSVYRPTLRPAIEFLQMTSGEQQSVELVGRRAEINYFATLLKRMANRPGSTDNRIIIIEGGSGLGKSKIIEEVEKLAQDLRIRKLAGAGNRLKQNSAYHAWMPVFHQIYEITAHDSMETRRAKVLEKLPYMPGERGYPALARNLAPLLNQVMSVQFKETPTTRSLSSSEKERITSDFLLRLVQIEASPQSKQRVPVSLLILEDAQWMDAASWNLTGNLLKHVPSVALILTVQPLPAALRRHIPKSGMGILRRKDAVRLRLEGLSVDEMEEMICQILNVNRLSKDLQDLLDEYAGGDPGLCKELVSHWDNSSLITRSSDSANLKIQSGEPTTYPIPDDLVKTLTGRFDQLSPTQQMILKIASLSEASFSTRHIQAAYPHPMNEATINRHLVELERVGFLNSNNDESESREYSVSNLIVQKIVRNLLPELYRSQIQSLLFNA